MISEQVKQLTLKYDDELHAATTQKADSDEHDYYVNNGGTVLAIAGNDFAVCLADTRLSKYYQIYTRAYKKYVQLTDKVVLASSGMAADCTNLQKRMQYEIRMYEFKHKKKPNLPAIAQLLSVILYYRRFFPFYAFNILVGLDDDGVGHVYEYDAVGSFDSGNYGIKGTGEVYGMPMLDVKLKKLRFDIGTAVDKSEWDKLDIINVAKSVMINVAERDIYTGDSADVIVIDKSGVSVSTLPLRID